MIWTITNKIKYRNKNDVSIIKVITSLEKQMSMIDIVSHIFSHDSENIKSNVCYTYNIKRNKVIILD